MPYNGIVHFESITDKNKKSGNISSHSEFQDGHQVFNNSRLNYIYHNKRLKPMDNYIFLLKVKNMAENVISADFNESHFEFQVNQDT